MTTTERTTGSDVMREFLPARPFVAHLGIELLDLAAADGQDVTATARVVRRGGRLVNVHVDVHTGDGVHVAAALVTYQLG